MKHIEYFYTSPEDIKNNIVEIKGAEFKHLSVVSRKKPHDIVHIIDGTGNYYTVLLTDVGKNYAIGEIQKKSRYLGEPNFKLTLAQAIPKGTRFDWVIEKGTEIGVSKFIPLITEYSVLKSGDTKLNRWRKVAIAAMKQSLRTYLPEITLPLSLDHMLRDKEIYDFNVMAHPSNNARGLADIVMDTKKALSHLTKIKKGIILIGPEGGFTDDEVKKATALNFQTYSLGQRRLRSETAGIISAAIMMELMDNML